MMQKSDNKSLADLKEKETFCSVFFVQDKKLGQDKNGKSFLTLDLCDASGSLNARMWDGVEDASKLFQSGEYLKVKGHLQVFQGRKQIVIHQLDRAEDSEVGQKDFVPKGHVDVDSIFREIGIWLSEMKNPWIREISQRSFNDPSVFRSLLIAPAAKTIHHAYTGGLLEHIHSIAKILRNLGDHYPDLDPDLLLFGAVFHDFGKVWELQVGTGIQYTNQGRLVGHMVQACDWLQEKSREIADFPQDLLDVLKHMVLSHHGKLEFGSPKLPSLPEAMVVAMIDELDSRVHSVLSYMKSELPSGEDWSRFHHQTDRCFFLPVLRNRLLEKKES